jgi:hypothetical protein
VDILADFRKHNRHSGILADGKIPFARRVHIRAEVGKDGFPDRRRLRFGGRPDTLFQVLRKDAVRFDAEPTHLGGNPF